MKYVYADTLGGSSVSQHVFDMVQYYKQPLEIFCKVLDIKTKCHQTGVRTTRLQATYSFKEEWVQSGDGMCTSCMVDCVRDVTGYKVLDFTDNDKVNIITC